VGVPVTLERSRAAADRLVERVAELVLERLSRPSTVSPYLSVAEAAERLRSDRQRVYDLLSSCRLRRYKDGTRVLVSRDEIDAYLAGDTRPPRIAPALPPRPQSRASRRLEA
jgi:excisionase family DNA binding protein